MLCHNCANVAQKRYKLSLLCQSHRREEPVPHRAIYCSDVLQRSLPYIIYRKCAWISVWYFGAKKRCKELFYESVLEVFMDFCATLRKADVESTCCKTRFVLKLLCRNVGGNLFSPDTMSSRNRERFSAESYQDRRCSGARRPSERKRGRVTARSAESAAPKDTIE